MGEKTSFVIGTLLGACLMLIFIAWDIIWAEDDLPTLDDILGHFGTN